MEQILTHTSIPITVERIRDLLISALEGGSNYWYLITEFDYGPFSKKDFEVGGSQHDEEYGSTFVLPFIEGCGLIIQDIEDESKDAQTWRLDRASLIRCINTMAQKYPRHYTDFINEDDDAITADVYLQCCLFGEIVYG